MLKLMIHNVIKSVMATSLSIVEGQVVLYQLQAVSMKFLKEDIVNSQGAVLISILI